MRMVLDGMALLLVESGGIVRPVRTTSAAPANVHVSTAPKAQNRLRYSDKTVFQSKCMPCHFSGGQMYDRLPFDKAATIKKLGTRLFTRIKETNDRKLIEDFLAQP
jgi:hypothetical protein